MAFNPEPKVAAARDFAKRHDQKMVVILFTDGETLGYASYGETPALCHLARKLADVAYNVVLDKIEEESQ